MQKLFWIGAKGFSDALHECGWNVVAFPEKSASTGKQNRAMENCDAEDVVVVNSGSLSLLPTIRKLPCITVLHLSSPRPDQKEIAAASGFDACLVTGSDYLNEIQKSLPPERILWSPPFAREVPPPEFSGLNSSCCFRANENQQVQGGQEDFLQKVSQSILNLEKLAHSAELKARLLLHTAAQGEFDSRIMDAMAHGCCLVLPRIGNGLEKLFVDGEHYVGYAKADAGDAVYRISFLYEHPDLIEHIGRTAAAEISSRHLAKHRAEAFTDFICDIFMNDHLSIINRRLQQNK